MNPVIKNIFERKNNPNFQGKIALVLYGGIMSGVVGTGATTALEELGLNNVFDYIFVYSAGLPNASYFLAEQSRLSSSVYIKDLSDSKFINYFKPWKLANIDYLIHVLRDIKPLNVNKIFERRTKIILRIRNISLNKNEYVEINNSFKNNYFDLIKGAVKMPILSPGSVSIGNSKYKDSPSLEKGFLNEINNYKDITDVLIIYNKQQQKVAINLPGKNYLEIIPGFVISGLETRQEILEKGFLNMKNLIINNFQK